MQSEERIRIHTEKKKRAFLLGTAVLMSIGLLCLFRLISPFTFYNNDDVSLQMIVSGDISGTPGPYMIHSHFLLGLLLSSLYRLAPSLPWYGLWICFCAGFCIFCITWRVLNLCKKIWQAALALFIEGLAAFGILFPILCREQFTVLAGLMGATALFWALTMKLSGNEGIWKQTAVLCALAVMTYCIRGDVFYMLLPFAGALWIGKYFLTEKQNRSIKAFFTPALLLLAVGVLLAGIQAAAYSGSQWKEFRKLSQARAALFDYTGFPDYEENQELYDTLGISEESYEAVVRHYMLLNNPDVTLENLTALSETAEKSRALNSGAEKNFTELLKVSLSRFHSSNFRLLSFLIVVLYLGLIGCTVLNRRIGILLQPALLCFVQTGIWMYLNAKGRFPDRVANCLFLIELFGLVAFYFEEASFGGKEAKAQEENRRLSAAGLCTALYVGVTAACAMLCVYYGRTLVTENTKQSKALLAFSENLQELTEYCSQNPENHYFVDLYATAYYTKDLLAVREKEPVNFLSLGGWAAKSPLTEERLDRWEIADAERAVIENPQVYVIFGDSSEFTMDYFVDYYQKKYPGSRFELIDTLTCESGTSFLIYQGKYESK